MKKYDWCRKSLVARCLVWAVALHTMGLQCLPGFAAVAQAKESKKVAKELAAKKSEPLPTPELSLGVRGAEDIFEGFGDILAPVGYSDKYGLLFLNPRFSAKDGGEEEANLGFGWRRMFSAKDYPFIAGANVYYDSRWTQFDNHFNQFGAGLEFLSDWVDARANYYWPEDDQELIREWTTQDSSVSRSSRSSSRLVDAGPVEPEGNQFVQEVTWERRRTTVTRTTTTTYFWEQFEAALEGFDCELGVKIPGLDKLVETRAFIGYQDFDTPFAKDDLEGMKARLEVRALPGLTLDAEWFEEERLNGTDYFVGGRVHLPFDVANIANGKNPFEGAGDNFKKAQETKLANRMTEMVMRDVKVQTQISEAMEKIQERVTSVQSSSSTKRSRKTTTEVILDDCTFVDQDNMEDPEMNGTYEHPFDVIQDGVDNANSPVYVDYSDYGPYYENVVVPGGVQVYGSGVSIEGYGGRRYASTEHPVVIGDGQTATFSVMGDNVTIAGFRIMSSYGYGYNPGRGAVIGPGGGIAAITSPNGNGDYDVTRAGIAGENVSRLIIRDNIFENVSYGAVFTDTLTDDKDAFVADFIGNTFNGYGSYGPGYGGLVVDTRGASGVFDVFMRDNAFNNWGGNGLFLDARDYDEAYLEIGGGGASDNFGNGLSLNLQNMADYALLYVHDFGAYGNFGDNIRVSSMQSGGDAVTIFDGVSAFGSMYGDGIHFEGSAAEAGGLGKAQGAVGGGQGLAVAAFNEISASYNYGHGMYIGADGARAFEGDATFVVENSVFNNNGALNSGVHVSRSGASTYDGDASVLFDNVTANYNVGSGIFFGDAVANAGGGIDAKAVNGFGGGDATAIFRGIEAVYNTGDGLSLGWLGGASAFGGNALFHMTDVYACDNGRHGIKFGMVGAEAFGGDADFFMGGIMANGNGYGYGYGFGSGIIFDLINFTVAHAMGGDATAVFSDIQANDNWNYGIFCRSSGAVAGGGIRVGDKTAGDIDPIGVIAGGNALLEFRNVEASYNGDGGIHFTDSGAVAGGGLTTADLNGSPNGYLEPIKGDATLRMINVTANYNGGELSGIHFGGDGARTMAGDASVTLQNVTASYNSGDGIYFGRNGAVAGGGFLPVPPVNGRLPYEPVAGGDASLTLVNVTANNNGGEYSGIHFGQYGAVAAAGGAENIDLDGLPGGNASVLLRNVNADDNAGDGIYFGWGGASALGGDASFRMTDCSASYNDAGGVYFGNAAAVSQGGNAKAKFQRVTAVGNAGGSGLAGARASAWEGRAKVRILDSEFSGNAQHGVAGGVSGKSGKFVARNTAFRNNAEDGILINSKAPDIKVDLGSEGEPGRNSFEGNGRFGVENWGGTASIRGNYWGGLAPLGAAAPPADYENTGTADPGADWLAADPNP